MHTGSPLIAITLTLQLISDFANVLMKALIIHK